ncbi:hypothetical protein PCE1_000731 [Barthelona sp. PCE]
MAETEEEPHNLANNTAFELDCQGNAQKKIETQKPKGFIYPNGQTVMETETALRKLPSLNEVQSRPIRGGNFNSYLSADTIIEHANEIFGSTGYSIRVMELKQDHLEEKVDDKGLTRYSLIAHAVIRVTFANGCIKENVGIGKFGNTKELAAAIDKAYKEAVTDGIKRCLRPMGSYLGHALDENKIKAENRRVADIRTKKLQSVMGGAGVPTLNNLKGNPVGRRREAPKFTTKQIKDVKPMQAVKPMKAMQPALPTETKPRMKEEVVYSDVSDSEDEEFIPTNKKEKKPKLQFSMSDSE